MPDRTTTGPNRPTSPTVHGEWSTEAVFAIGVVAPSQCSSITMLGLFDVIGRADRAYGVLKGRPGTATIYDVS